MAVGRPKTLHFIHVGPAIPVVPVKDFSRFADVGITQEMFKQAWTIVGPSVERNMQMKCEAWELYTACYLEGLAHGSQMAMANAEAKMKTETGNLHGELNDGPIKRRQW